MTEEYIAQVAELKKGMHYVAAGGGSMFSLEELAHRVLPALEGGLLFAYLFRRFGYPSTGWDSYKDLVRYVITTPMPHVFLSITPYMGWYDVEELSFGYCVARDIQDEYYALLPEEIDTWENHPRYKECMAAFEAALRDLLRPVFVRDVGITCYGQIDENEECPLQVEYYHAAGHPIPQALLRDRERYVTFIDAVATLGGGNLDAGIEHIIGLTTPAK